MRIDKQNLEYPVKHTPFHLRVTESSSITRSRIITIFCVGFAIGITLGQLVHLAATVSN